MQRHCGLIMLYLSAVCRLFKNYLMDMYPVNWRRFPGLGEKEKGWAILIYKIYHQSICCSFHFTIFSANFDFVQIPAKTPTKERGKKEAGKPKTLFRYLSSLHVIELNPYIRTNAPVSPCPLFYRSPRAHVRHATTILSLIYGFDSRTHCTYP
jgi:hypothetical protein